jgi:putative transposase
MIGFVDELSAQVTVQVACDALHVPRSTFYRAQSPVGSQIVQNQPVSTRGLQPDERQVVLDTLDGQRFQDSAPREVYATLLDEQIYLCHWRTMYRILAEHQQVCERRNQLCHPHYARPELLATGPNQVWCWDITALRGPDKWSAFYLYDLMDVYSRYVVGWLIAQTQSATLAEQLIAQSVAKHAISAGQLTLHADNGAPMKAKTVAQLMADLGVTESHSRPHVSDDNPYSEAQFKTLKYRPDYPNRFADLPDAQSWARRFFTWYNNDHHHTGLGLLTPAVVHFGHAPEVLAARQLTLDLAFAAHPDRFVRGAPKPQALPDAVWINPPKPIQEATSSDNVNVP